MDLQEIEGAVTRILAAVLKRDFTPGQDITRENTEKWDSLKHVEIMFAVEEEFGVEFSEDELGNLDSVRSIASAVRAKHAA